MTQDELGRRVDTPGRHPYTAPMSGPAEPPATAGEVPYPIRSLPIHKRAYLLWGKVRRWYLVHFRPGYVRAALARRRGQCDHSGACCQLAHVCPLHGPDAHGAPGCTIYARRPANCRVFPIDERDLRDRDVVMPDHPCGFYFVAAETAAAKIP